MMATNLNGFKRGLYKCMKESPGSVAFNLEQQASKYQLQSNNGERMVCLCLQLSGTL